MPLRAHARDLAICHCVCLGACTILSVWLGTILHRAGSLFLDDFRQRRTIGATPAAGA